MVHDSEKNSNSHVTLSDLKPGMKGFVSGLQLDGLLYRRLLDFGITRGTKIKALFSSPSGDPIVYRVRSTNIAMRKKDASLVNISLKPMEENKPNYFGKNGKEPQCLGNPPLGGVLNPRNNNGQKPFIVALAGNPNTGKSTVFNALTGLHQHIGNWPGKTIRKAQGDFRFHQNNYNLVDLPGTYSLIPNSQEEEIARDFLLFEIPDCTIVVTDATCLERNLNLVFQIIQITNRVVVCVNLLDEAARKGIRIDLEGLEERLDVPVAGIVARAGKGLDKLMERVDDVATGKLNPSPRVMGCDPELEEAILKILPAIEKLFPLVPNPRWLAMQLIDGCDTGLLEKIQRGFPVMEKRGNNE